MFRILDAIPSHKAPPGGALTDAMLADYEAAGVLILEDFVPLEDCDRLRERALQLVGEFDPQTVRHVFSTTKQTQLDDSYFYESGDKIRFFLEDDAFDEHGTLRQAKEHSLNKMGHAMHDLDPVFDAFSRTSELAALVGRSLEAHVTRLAFQAWGPGLVLGGLAQREALGEVGADRLGARRDCESQRRHEQRCGDGRPSGLRD